MFFLKRDNRTTKTTFGWRWKHYFRVEKIPQTIFQILSRLLIVLVSRQSELSRLDIELIMISRVGVGVGAETGNQGGEVGPGRNQI